MLFGIGAKNDTAVTFARLFFDIVAFLFFCFCLFGIHVAADHFDRMMECIVIRINDHLCQDRRYGFEDASF